MTDCIICGTDVPSGDDRCWKCSMDAPKACNHCGLVDCKGCDNDGGDPK